MSIRSLLDKYYFDHILGTYWATIIFMENLTALLFIEPAAGDGAFSNVIFKLIKKWQRCIAIDIDPEGPNIIKHDFFTFRWKKYFLPVASKVVTILSPPFGKMNQLVYRFFNDCAERSDTIYLICSRIFKKPHTHKKLNKYFHLEWSKDLPTNTFTLDGETVKGRYALRCCIQKWVRKDIKRAVNIKHESKYFSFVKKGKIHNFAVCFTGHNAGKVVNSTYKKIYRLKFKSKYKYLVTYIKNNINLEKAAINTINIKSVTQYEIIAEVDRLINKYYHSKED